ncbi:LAME_0D08768g1_1 [Lachancea meyersii CBS 8951]|uniref:LAME_0D08768g1_1 n=1 Tax=Lachancea meyersii CBS 8951 TaxID=1266667 RepID=A0A1G4JAP3_9SACH|nr:LAME_0D08768g1_1 [Lachancea meyersii CBS 8951]
MGLGINRKPHKVPDLSRYDYHYQTKDEESGKLGLSAAAAAASAGRSRSLVHSRKPLQARPETAHGRSYSLRNSAKSNTKPISGNSEQMGSLTKGRPSLPTPGRTASRSNSIVTVHTTEVRDPTGRTHSITKKSVRRVNGYEYVETTTTTTTTNAAGPGDTEKHFNEFTTDFSQDFEFDHDQNHDQGEDHDRFIMSSGVSDTLREEDEEDDIDIDDASFMDAMDYLPKSKTTKPTAPVPRKVKRLAKPKQALSEQEIYAKALEAARKKVYGDQAVDNAGPSVATRNATRLGSLRETPAIEPATPRTKRRSFSLKKLGQKQARPQNEAVNNYEKPNQTRTTLRDQLPAVGSSSHARRMSDGEIHAKALELAREQYAAGKADQPTVISPIEAPDLKNSLVEAPYVEAPHAEAPPTKTGSSNSKVKNFFNKVAQFSHENYGYQTKNGKQSSTGASSENKVCRESPSLENERRPVANDANGHVQEPSNDDGFQDKVNSVLKSEDSDLARDNFAQDETDINVKTSSSDEAMGNATAFVPVNAEFIQAGAADTQVVNTVVVQSETLETTSSNHELSAPTVSKTQQVNVEEQPNDLEHAETKSLQPYRTEVVPKTGFNPSSPAKTSSGKTTQATQATQGTNDTQPQASTLASSVSSSQANFSRQSVRGSLPGPRQDQVQPGLYDTTLAKKSESTDLRTTPALKSSQRGAARKPTFLQKLFKRSSKKTKQN